MKFFSSLLILAVVCLGLTRPNATAQNYSGINKKRVDVFYAFDPKAPNQKKMVKLKVYDIDVVASDSIMYLGPEFNGTTRFSGSNPSCPKTQSSTFIGDATNKRFRDNVYINKNGWSFNVKWNVPVGGKFQFNSWNTDSIKMGLTLTAVRLSNYFGVPDSVRIFTINRIDASGNTIPHIFNGKTMVLSKNYGWVKTYGMWEFPYDTTSYYRATTLTPNMPYKNLKSTEIYGMQVGDEYHLISYCAACFIPGPIALTKRKVLNVDNSDPAKRVFTFGDSLRTAGQISYQVSTQTVVWSDVNYLDSSTFAVNVHGSVAPRYQAILYQRQDAIASRLKVVDTAQWKEDLQSLPNCYRRPASGGLANWRYFEMAGGPFSENYLRTDELVYIKNRVVTKGNPIRLDTTLLATPSALISQQVRFAPNPANKMVKVLLPQEVEIKEVIAVNAIGKQQPILFSGQEINLEGLVPGLYTIRIKTNTNISFSGKLKVE